MKQTRTVRAALAVVAVIAAVGTEPAAADRALAVGLDHLRDGRDEAARATLDRIEDPALQDVMRWHLLRARRGSFAEAVAFLDRNPDWPGLPLLRGQVERAMPVALPPAEVDAFFAESGPRTPEGALRHAVALRALGRTADAETTAIETWLTAPMSIAAQAGFVEIFGDVLEPFHPARLDAMVWTGEARAAERMIGLVTGPEVPLARARLALRSGRAGVDGLIAAVPAALADHQGLAYERFRWRLAKGRRDDALEMLFAYDADADSLGHPTAWAPHRERLARGLMQDGRIAEAYRVAARHHLPPGDRDAAQIEWLAGYLALRFLGDAPAAVDHFRRFDGLVRSPISKGRAGYWLGRALEAVGDPAGARTAYEAGARYQTSFYGQLAAERAQVPADPRLTGREDFPPLDETALADSTAFAAARALIASGHRDLGERFAAHLAEVLPREEVGTLIDRVLAWEEPHVALIVAKRAAQRGWELHRGYFPVTDAPRAGGRVAPALSLAIARRESEFDPVVVSHAGARGLMQLMPRTAQAMAAAVSEPFALRRLTTDPGYNARLGNAYLATLEDRFGMSPVLVPAAYNAGPSRAYRWSDRFGDPSDPGTDIVDWIEDVPFSETRNYIMRVSESLLPYEARLTGEVGAVRLSRWLKEGYDDLRPVAGAQGAKAIP